MSSLKTLELERELPNVTDTPAKGSPSMVTLREPGLSAVPQVRVCTVPQVRVRSLDANQGSHICISLAKAEPADDPSVEDPRRPR
jgi:hypothetical protein